ncbi:MAG: hypothetical protein ACOZAA_12280 [Pseudomonadota bacterium]
MCSASSRNPIVRKILLSAATIGVAAAIPAPAFAGGRHGGHHGGGHYYPHHYDYGYHPSYHHYPYYNYRHHRSHISAGEGALIAAGIIGGVILIDRALDNRDRYDDRRYDDRYRRGAFDDDYYYQRDDRAYDDGRYSGRAYDRGFEEGYSSARLDRDADQELLGDDFPGEGHARPRFADAAFRECVAETKGAAGAGGMRVAMPGAPTEVEELADGSVRLTAQFRASNARGEQWTRRFVCEADEAGVRFLQVD